MTIHSSVEQWQSFTLTRRSLGVSSNSEYMLMLSKRAITLCKIILQLTIITNKMYAILGGLLSGGLKSGGLKSAHRETLGRMLFHT